ncbi:MAG: hypothetical protein ACXVC0_00285 [Bdellovibrionota bacterium]
MKILTLALALAYAPLAHAGWQRILTCDGAVVDVNDAERRKLQIWVKDQNVLHSVHDKGLEQLSFGQNEYVVYGSTRWRMDFANPTGPKAIYDFDHAKGVFSPQDFTYFTADRLGMINLTHVGSLVTIYREGSGLSLQYQTIEARGCAGKTVPNDNPEGGPGDGQWGSRCDGDDYTALIDQAKFHFENCR